MCSFQQRRSHTRNDGNRPNKCGCPAFSLSQCERRKEKGGNGQDMVLMPPPGREQACLAQDPGTLAEQLARQPWGVLGLHQLNPHQSSKREEKGEHARLTLHWVAKDEELFGREIPYYMLQPPQKLRNSSYKINQTQA